ncbi:hypothetical protein B0H17DRAFT_232025 [Mycena rosella]|uniref:Monopolin complex subunit Csm1/Pcs1 C-terminal domain-containing protein n=1 Tax=Mycena rosella TaxID=1033263 RepID=A0AAD7MBM8_MYCRO|nr:hypothetical protein B0H17DRAFT_232025 [Mycena rosella]
MSATGSERVTRTRAGSSKPAPKPKRKQAKEIQEEEESDDFTAMVQDGDEDDEITEVEPPRKKPTARPANLNGKSVAKGKGKAKADAAPTKKASARAEVEIVDDDDEGGPVEAARAINDATTNNRATKSSGRAGPATATKQIEQLTRQLETAQDRINDLAKQLEESYRVRQTEPEELMQRQVQKYEEIIRTKDALLKQQEEMLSQKEPLSRDGKHSVLHMVTREKADAEKNSSEEQVTFWKTQADVKNRLIEEREQQIAELKQIQSDLQYEIKTERENSQKASRNPPSVQRARGPNAVLGSDDPKHAELVSFYEDVTNLLVTDIKIQEPKYFNLDEWALTCVYTYADKTGSEASKRSLSFLLRFTHDPLDAAEPVESKEDLDRAAQYTPLHLDKENPDFITALQFLNTGFTFPRTQLPIFFSSLVENMKAACEGESESGSENDESMEDVQLVE